MKIEEYNSLSKLGRAKFITDILAALASQILMFSSLLYCAFNIRTIFNQHSWAVLVFLPVSMIIVVYVFVNVVFNINKWFRGGK